MKTVVTLFMSALLVVAAISEADAQAFFRKTRKLHRPNISRAITGPVEQPIPRPRGMEESRATWREDGLAEYGVGGPSKREVRREMARTRALQRRASHAHLFLASVKDMREHLYNGQGLVEHTYNGEPYGR